RAPPRAPPPPTAEARSTLVPPRPSASAPWSAPSGPTRRAHLGAVFGARSGDKGGNANVGVWARSTAAHAGRESFPTAERFRELVPEAARLEVRRYELPNLLALNFVVVGLLGDGVAASTRFDPQAKGLGEYLRSRRVDLPTALLHDEPC